MSTTPSHEDDVADELGIESTQGTGGEHQLAAATQGERYVLLDPIGAGGMATVYNAYDRKLDRKIAVKLLHLEEGRRASPVRLLREAQALARLKHPNVVTVYDAGTLGNRVFLAMELVEGKSLRAWLEERPRAWREVARVFLQAGRGLAAAHAQGLVHRDFKPDNALVGADGVVRVADFGLARLQGTRDEDSSSEGVSEQELLSGERSALSLDVTKTGAVLGTPRYMPPEQRRGLDADARADQYSFCVALYEGLYRAHPFAGAVGKEARVPAKGRVPKRLRDAVLRGLRRNPEERFADLGPILAALAADPAVVRRRVLYGVLAAAAVATAAVVGMATGRHAAGAACEGIDPDLAAAWGPERRAAVHAAFAKTGKPYAEAAASAVEKRLDGYVAQIAAARREACQAARGHGSEPAEIAAVRRACVDDRLGALRAVVELFGAADAQVVSNAQNVAAALPSVADCAGESGARRLPADPELRARAADVQAKAERAHLLDIAGKRAQARPLAEEALTEARALGHAPTVAKAQLVAAVTAEQAGDYAVGERGFVEAVVAAAGGGDDTQLVEAMASLAMDVGRMQRRYEEGRRWARAALALSERLGHRRLIARAEQAIGLIDFAEGKFEDAARHQRRVLETLENDKEVGPDAPETASVLNSLGNCVDQLGRHDEALALYRRALAVRERAFGSIHPLIAMNHNNIAVALEGLGDTQGSYDEMKLALDIDLQASGPQHPIVAREMVNLGHAAADLERPEDALDLYRRALPILEKAFGPASAEVASAHRAVGEGLREVGHRDEALRELEYALELSEKAYPADHPELARALVSLGELELEKGRLDAARGHLERGAAIHAKRPATITELATLDYLTQLALAQGRSEDAAALAGRALKLLDEAPALPRLRAAPTLMLLARARTAQGDTAGARAALERAVSLADAHPGRDPSERTAAAETRFALARALPDAEKERAVTLARQAREGTPPSAKHAELRREIDAWLQGK